MKTETYDALAEDEIRAKPYDVRLMKRLLRYMKPHLGLGLLSLAVLMIGSLLQLAGPYLTKIAVDRYILPGDRAGLVWIAGLYLLALCLGFVFQSLRVYLLQLTGQRVMFHMRTEVFGHVLKMSSSFLDRTPKGRLVTRSVHDVEVINQLFTQGIIVIFGDLVTLVGITAILLWMDWRLAMVLFSVIPFLVLASAGYRIKARDAYREVRRHVARLNAYLQENLSGMSTVQLYNRQEENFRRFDVMNQAARDEHLRSIKYSALFFPFVEVISAASLGLIIWYGGGRVIQEALLPGVLVAFIQYLRQFYQPLRDLAEKYNILQAAMAASERVFELLDTFPEIQEPRTLRKPEHSRGAVQFRNVWFAYSPGKWVLRGVDFRIEPGETVALVGTTGAGKSSLIGLMARFYEADRGQIWLDEVEVRQCPLHDLRRFVGIIPQDVFLFAGTLLDNLRLWNARISETRVREVAKSLQVDSFIRGLPGGYHAKIREGGENLSRGQRQLIAFVRILLYEPNILVLDEATSSIDPATETLIQTATQRLIRGHTSLIIAHRLSTIQDADRIIVLHRGVIWDDGTHEQLMARSDIYQRMYQLHEAGLGESGFSST